METIQNLVEYYDELFPVTQAQYDFYTGLMEEFQKPVKFLTIGCGTGVKLSCQANDRCYRT